MSSNGEDHSNERKPVTSTLTLTFNHDTFHLDVNGEAPAYEVFLAMIDQAKTYFSDQLRAQNLQQLQKQLIEQRRNLAIVDRVAGRG